LIPRFAASLAGLAFTFSLTMFKGESMSRENDRSYKLND